MADRLTTELVRQITEDPELVAALREALGVQVDAEGRIDHHAAAARWGLAASTVAKWCRAGKLDCVKVGRMWLVHPDAKLPQRERPEPKVAPAPKPAAGRRRSRQHAPSSVAAAMRGQ